MQRAAGENLAGWSEQSNKAFFLDFDSFIQTIPTPESQTRGLKDADKVTLQTI